MGPCIDSIVLLSLANVLGVGIEGASMDMGQLPALLDSGQKKQTSPVSCLTPVSPQVKVVGLVTVLNPERWE